MLRISQELFDVDESIELRLTDDEIGELTAQCKAVGIPDTKVACDFIFSVAMTAKAGTMLPSKCMELLEVKQELEDVKRRLAEYQSRCQAMSEIVDEKTNTIRILSGKMKRWERAEDRNIEKLLKRAGRNRKQQEAANTCSHKDGTSAHFVSELPTWML